MLRPLLSIISKESSSVSCCCCLLQEKVGLQLDLSTYLVNIDENSSSQGNHKNDCSQVSKWVILYRIVFLALLQADTVIAHVDIIYEPTHVLCKHEYFLLTGQSFLKLLYYWWSWKTAPKVQFVLITSSQHNECMSWMIKLVFWMTQRDRNTRWMGIKWRRIIFIKLCRFMNEWPSMKSTDMRW